MDDINLLMNDSEFTNSDEMKNKQIQTSPIFQINNLR